MSKPFTESLIKMYIYIYDCFIYICIYIYIHLSLVWPKTAQRLGFTNIKQGIKRGFTFACLNVVNSSFENCEFIVYF